MAPTRRRQPSGLERAVRAGVGLTVSLLAWPEEDDVRRQLSALGLPRLLLVDAKAAPPEPLDPYEDWVRSPADQADIEARAKALAGRLPAPEDGAPALDEDGLLHVGRAWVVIPPTQLAVVQVLLDNFNRVVRTATIAEACTAAGASAHPASIRTLLSRLGARVRSVGLELVTVRQRGVLLRRAAPATTLPPDA